MCLQIASSSPHGGDPQAQVPPFTLWKRCWGAPTCGAPEETERVTTGAHLPLVRKELRSVPSLREMAAGGRAGNPLLRYQHRLFLHVQSNSVGPHHRQ